HDVRVLTSTYGVDGPRVDGHVYRWLTFELAPRAQSSLGQQWALFRKELANRRALLRLLGQFTPDLAYVWNIHNASLSLVRMAQRRRLPMTAFISDNWLAHWEARDSWDFLPRHPVRRLARLGLGAILAGLAGGRLPHGLRLEQAQFASAFLRGLTAPSQPALGAAPVIHWGIDPALFERPRSAGGGRLLFAGQVVEHKGVHTAIDALARLRSDHGRAEATLTIVGAAPYPEYRARLERQVADLGLEPYVRWVGMVPRSDLAAIYADHDVLVFPSVWDEPFSITLLEALGAGLAVVASATGGTPELISEGETGLLFPRSDSAACAAALGRLCADPGLRERLARQGRDAVRRSFTLAAMVDQIEADLRRIVSLPPSNQLARTAGSGAEGASLIRSARVKKNLQSFRRAAGRGYAAARPALITLARAAGLEKPARAVVRRVIARSRRPAAWRWPSETSKCRARLDPYCVGYGADLGFGGDPINDRAVRVDMPQPYTQLGAYPVQLGGNADSLVWFADASLDYLYSSHLLEDFVDTRTVLAEWLRVLKVGGRLIIYCPDEQRFRAHCQATGQPYNPHHKHADFSIDFVKRILAGLGQTTYLYENPDVDGYSWEFVCVKTQA
ncbi:MAG TPA: glycosyltransferase, partial [Herpetosiphonaceae bacterium]|nr:glycosyltransferase [Herpetosiphonaceae bacterium]